MELFQLTAHELNNKIKNKEISVEELVQSFFDRIKQTDSNVNAYISLNEEKALEQAKEVQEKFDKGHELSPLAGMPISIKDNICTKGILTTGASKMLHNFVPPYDATVVEKLSQIDTILLGKANLDEFAMGTSTEFSAIKTTKNPWDLSRIPGGSSGGPAASVSAGEAVFSIASDTGGSIRQPSMLCGLVGMKPTYGSVSRYGLIALASSLDQIGPITKDVTDCALVLNAICGHDKMDSTSANRNHPDYSKHLTNDIKGMKIGVPNEFINSDKLDEDIKQTVIDAIEVLRKLGASVEYFDLPINDYCKSTYTILSSAEASSNFARFDGIKYGHSSSQYADVSELYSLSRGEGFGPEVKRRILLGTYVLSSEQFDLYYKKALQARTLIIQKFKESLEKYDIIAGPVSPFGAIKFGEISGDSSYYVDMFTVSANIAGLPAASIPCGFDKNGMPSGLQLIGNYFDEGTILRAAYTYEQNTEWHKMRAKI